MPNDNLSDASEFLNDLRMEPLLRRYFADPGNPTVVPLNAFRPNPNDESGISVSFQSFPLPIARVLADTLKPKSEYAVCVFSLSTIPELSVSHSPTPKDFGHATIPEICTPYDELPKSHPRRKLLKAWQVKLRELAKPIHQPGDPIEYPHDLTPESQGQDT